MKSLFKGIGSVLFYVLAAGLVIYAGSRSLDFIQSTLPPDQKLIGWLGLLATEGGAIVWLVVFLKQSQGLGQKVISFLSAVMDMGGSIMLFTFDTLIRSAQNGAILELTPDDVKNVILALSGLIGVNLIAVFAFHVFDPENMRKMREDAAHDAVQGSLLKQIEENAENLAKEMLPDLYAQWEGKFKANFGDVANLHVGNFQNHGIPVEPKNPFVMKGAEDGSGSELQNHDGSELQNQRASVQSPLSFSWLPWMKKNWAVSEASVLRSAKVGDPERTQGITDAKSVRPRASAIVSPADESSNRGAADGGNTATTPASNPPIEQEEKK